MNLTVLTDLNYLEYTEMFVFPKIKHHLKLILDLLGTELNLNLEEGIICIFHQEKTF